MKYQLGGSSKNLDKKQLMQMFLETLPEDKQDQFIDEFQSLTPEEQESFYQELAARMQQQMGQSQPQPQIGQMQQGGLTVPPNVEVEGGETTLLPDGRLEKFTGPKHKDGGIETNLPPGSYVFSEHLKVPKELAKQILGRKTRKNYTYAELSKKFPTKPFTDVLENPDTDHIEKETAAIKLHTHNAMLQTLFAAQEGDKNERNNINLKSQSDLPKAQAGILTPDSSFGGGAFGGGGAGGTWQDPEPKPKPEEKPEWQVWLENSIADSREFEPPVPIPLDPDKTEEVPPPTVIHPRPQVPIPVTIPQLPTPKQVQSQTKPPALVINQQVQKDKEKNKLDLGISRQLAGTILDSLLAASDNINVDNPQYRDNRKYPLFTRFVDFEDKEVGKMYNAAMQQILNSNAPQQVKDAQIANLNAKLQDYQGKQDFQNAQRYQQKLDTDTQKLQQYLDYNVDQSAKDLDTYREKKARVDYLVDQFRARRKSGIINPWRQYFDFMQKTALQNQLYADNYEMNPITGKIKYRETGPDVLSQQEQNLAQFAKNNPPIVLGNGITATPMGNGDYIITAPTGAPIIYRPSEKENKDTDVRQQKYRFQNLNQ